MIGLLIGVKRANAYDFVKDSGAQATAEETGHLSMPFTDPMGIVGVIIGVVLSFVGVIFLILTIYAGYLWMTASGNEEQIKKAQNILRNSIVGLIIVLSAYAITAFIGNVLK